MLYVHPSLFMLPMWLLNFKPLNITRFYCVYAMTCVINICFSSLYFYSSQIDRFMINSLWKMYLLQHFSSNRTACLWETNFKLFPCFPHPHISIIETTGNLISEEENSLTRPLSFHTILQSKLSNEIRPHFSCPRKSSQLWHCWR